jgi:hypothetical protein
MGGFPAENRTLARAVRHAKWEFRSAADLGTGAGLLRPAAPVSGYEKTVRLARMAGIGPPNPPKPGIWPK